MKKSLFKTHDRVLLNLNLSLQEGKNDGGPKDLETQGLKTKDQLGATASSPSLLEKTQVVLAKLENKSLFESEKILAREFNHEPKAGQKIKPQKDQSVRLEVTLTQEQYELIKKAQSLMSHVVRENNLAEVITALAQSFIQKKEGVMERRKAEEALTQELPKGQAPEQKGTQGFPQITQSFSNMQLLKVLPKRKYFSVFLKRELLNKAQHGCEYQSPLTGKKCQSRYQLQIDHLIPLAKGGGHEAGNLRVLCATHNRSEARRWGLKYLRKNG